MLFSIPKMELEDLFFQTASYLTEPICKTHEYFRKADVVDQIARKCFFWIAAFVCAALSIFTTLPGIALRAAAVHFQEKPFRLDQGPELKVLKEGFSLLSWNLCCVPGGYPISDGGVTPWDERIEFLIEKITETDADVNCFYEVFDRRAESWIKKALLKHGYTHFYTNIGVQAIGAPSGIMIASKFKMSSPEWTLFPQETLVGRTRWAAKGIFSFTLESECKPFAQIFSTHLQHSEIPEYIADQADETEKMRRVEEVSARKKQMQILVDKINCMRDRAIIVTGDLNMDDEEYASSDWNSLFIQAKHDGKTWGGDGFCARLTGKRPSGPLNLDHTMLFKETAHQIQTKLIDTGFHPNRYLSTALSDHKGVWSWIELTR